LLQHNRRLIAHGPRATPFAAARDRVVADYSKAYLDIVLSYPQRRCVMAWGLSDRYSWLQGTGARPDGLPKRCGPYDDAM
jgi:endo-1,4-beta-xylanase